VSVLYPQSETDTYSVNTFCITVTFGCVYSKHSRYFGQSYASSL